MKSIDLGNNKLIKTDMYMENADDVVMMKAEVFGRRQRHEHEFIELVYVISGRGKHIIQDETIETKQGDIFILNAHVPHEFYSDQSSSFIVYNCMFQPTALNQSLNDPDNFLNLAYRYLFHSFHSEQDSKNYITLVGSQNGECKAILDTMFAEYSRREEGYKEVLKANLTVLLIAVFRLYKKSAEQKNIPYYQKLVVERSYQYIKEHYREKIRCENIAEYSYLSLSYFNRIFKGITGITAMNALQNYRIEAACEMLIHSDLQISDIAYAVGYTDIKFFYALFRKAKGTTPGDYRKQKIKL